MRRLLPFLVVGVALALASGCGDDRPPPEPPVARVEVRPAQPPGEYVWVDGHWAWRAGAYEWIPGHWQVRQYGATWVPGHYVRRRWGYEYVPGHWR